MRSFYRKKNIAGSILIKKIETVIFSPKLLFEGKENARVLSCRLPILPMGRRPIW